jgi:diguanylate cyclase (GGDEF)-like protein
VGRYGGEEFVVVLRHTSLEGARRVADRIRQSVSARPLAELPRVVTVSAGVATRLPGEPVRAVIGRADYALYSAKNAGRNCISVAPPPSVPPFDSVAPPASESQRPRRWSIVPSFELCAAE